MKLIQRSLKRLKGVHPDLVRVVKRAAEITGQPFQITEGLRSKSRQRELVRKGASKTMRSRHLTGHAVDVVAMIGGRISWETALYYKIADAMKKAARELDIPIRWGGDWRTFFDGPHFQLPRTQYPGSGLAAGGNRAHAHAKAMIRPGDYSEDVRLLQARLGIIVDGRFGPNTRRHVVRFQKNHDLVADGIAGAKTRKAMGI